MAVPDQLRLASVVSTILVMPAGHPRRLRVVGQTGQEVDRRHVLLPVHQDAAGRRRTRADLPHRRWHLGVLDNIWFMVIIYTAMNLPIAIWMIRSFLADIPPALFEAASIDGAGLGPDPAPGHRADRLPRHRLHRPDLLHLLLERIAVGQPAHRHSVAQTSPVYLTSFVTSQGLFLAQLCAAATAVSLPVLIAGFAAQDKLVQGLSLGAVK